MGGTFDPIHMGHLVTAEEARVQFGLDRVIFVPNRHPPHKDPLAVTDPGHRCRMTLLATVSNPYFAVSRMETERPGPSYTIDTIREMTGRLRPAQVYYITGADALQQILRGEWREASELLRLCRVIAATRPGYPLDPAVLAGHNRGGGGPGSIVSMEIPALAISSTDIRGRVRGGRPIKYLVPEAVEYYVYKHNLYHERDA
ncbi:MAG: nicotinate-nucleotide adenylyltransferase [Armatimonadetes bacterium]|nr:nicotinate-nucleotide adenylyltransferase [Armatimonadota bacterium]